MLRSFLFLVSYWLISLTFMISLTILSIIPGHKLLRFSIVQYAKTMRWAMGFFGGIKFTYRGAENLPDGPFIIAAKHQSWGDGFGAVSYFGDIAFVTGDHLERYPLVGQILKKIGAIVVDSCGGHTAQKKLTTTFSMAAEEGRSVLIYPEGHLVKIGERIKYRSGVWHLQQECDWPVVPVATNLGLFWSCQDFLKEKGEAINEFLEPIPAGLSKDEFMTRLEKALDENSKRLCEEGQAKHPYLTQANVKWPDRINMIQNGNEKTPM